MAKPTPDLQTRIWRLDRNYKVLANQRQILETLSLALQLRYGECSWYDKGTALLHLIADEVYETCELIYQDALVKEALEKSE